MLIADFSESVQLRSLETIGSGKAQREKIDFVTLALELEMQVWTGGVPALPDVSDNVALGNVLPLTDAPSNPGEMGVPGDITIRVTDLDESAVSTSPTGVCNFSSTDGDHGRPGGRRVVDRAMRTEGP